MGSDHWWDQTTDFNPRSREGSDGCWQASALATWISIHAPVKGATSGPRRPHRAPCNFNPRSREGSDKDVVVKVNGESVFQSTLP